MQTETRKNLNDSNISRREYLKTISLGITGLTLGTLGSQFTGCEGLNTKERPNILIMVADDAGWRDVGFHDSEINTPNIDELTRTGVELDQFYVCPTCSPTRASLLTGRFA
ncbi:sulfatase-like hydrolase/transferase, partial [candidate division KSB1 bacterium]|nr:sulfatase-like hydrolase/transferase [candidate division KSB1 bacterium]